MPTPDPECDFPPGAEVLALREFLDGDERLTLAYDDGKPLSGAELLFLRMDEESDGQRHASLIPLDADMARWVIEQLTEHLHRIEKR